MAHATVVRVEAAATDRQRDLIRGAISSLEQPDVVVEDHVFEGRGGPFDIPIIVEIVVTAPIAAFLAKFFGRAGEDAWEGLKRFVRRLREPTGDGPIQLNIVEPGLQLTLTIDTRDPDGALDALGPSTIADLQRCTVFFDSEAQAWEISLKPVLDDDVIT